MENRYCCSAAKPEGAEKFLRYARISKAESRRRREKILGVLGAKSVLEITAQ